MPRKGSPGLAVALTLAWAVLPAGPASAAMITVGTTADEASLNNGRCALREAIEAANTDSAVGGCAAGDARARTRSGWDPAPTALRFRRSGSLP